VWLSTDCIAAANGAIKSASSATVTVAKFKEQIPVIELGITTENANKVEIQVKIEDAKARLELAKTKLAAAPNEGTKKIYTSAVASWTSAIRAYESKIRAIDLAVKKLEAAKLSALNKPAELAANVADSRETAKLICTTGL
jgi:predicted  nucleic acid-binding Zn-ribbon protein